MIDCFDFIIAIACYFGIHLHDGRVKRACPESKSDDSTGDWTAVEDRANDVFVDQEASSVFVLVLFPAVADFMAFVCWGFTEVISI